jgi:hypothetical protein
MTKRDYELIAEAINKAARGLDEEPVRKSPENFARAIGEVFAERLRSTNPHFDSERFVRACMGVDEAPHAKVRRQKTLRDNKARLARVFGSKV